MTRIWLVAATTLDEIFIQVLQEREGGD